MEDMSVDQLRIIERDVLFGKITVTGPDIHHRLNADDPFTAYQHVVNRRNKFAHVLDGEENYAPDRVIQRNNLIWRDNKYVIPMRLLAPFFTINSEIPMNLIIKFNSEQDTKKLFEAIVANGGEEVDRRPGLTRAVFYDVPKIMYNTYTFSPRQGSIHDQAMSKLKGKRAGIKPHYHEKRMVIRQGGFGSILNFDNAGTQFEWIIVSIISVLSKEHRNTYSVYNNEKATHMIQKITLSNMKDSRGLYISKVYDLTELDNQL